MKLADIEIGMVVGVEPNTRTDQPQFAFGVQVATTDPQTNPRRDQPETGATTSRTSASRSSGICTFRPEVRHNHHIVTCACSTPTLPTAAPEARGTRLEEVASVSLAAAPADVADVSLEWRSTSAWLVGRRTHRSVTTHPCRFSVRPGPMGV